MTIKPFPCYSLTAKGLGTLHHATLTYLNRFMLLNDPSFDYERDRFATATGKTGNVLSCEEYRTILEQEARDGIQ